MAIVKDGIVRTGCGLCLLACGMLVHLKDGKVVKVEGDPQSPQTGSLCIRGLVAMERLYHPDRLKHPQKRVGKRGEGKWERISWDEALDTIADKMVETKEAHGAESVAFIRGSAKGYHLESIMGRFANLFGTPNISSASHVCHVPRQFASTLTFGSMPVPDFGYPPACILQWGSNPFETSSIRVKVIRKALDNGTKIIVVNPRKVGFGEKADMLLQLRPGTDLALALGMLHVIVNEKLYDKDFVDNWTVGFDKLSEHVQDYSPQKMEEITWVPADTIIEAARLYATTKPACIQWGNALDHNINSFQAARAISILGAITGNLAVPGGDLLIRSVPMIQRPEFMLNKKRSKEQFDKRVGDRYLPMFGQIPSQTLIKAILEEDPYPIRVAFMVGVNPLMTYSNSKEVYQALNKVEFLAASDLFMTPSVELADIVLPAASFFEFDSIAGVGMQVQQKVVQVGECWSDYKIFNELAKRVGIEEDFWDDEIGPLNTIIEPSSIDFEELRKIVLVRPLMEYRRYKTDGFDTPSGKVEIFSTRLQKMGFDPLPVYHEFPETPFSDPELAKEYPLIFTTCKSVAFRHASDRNLPTLRKMHPEPLVEIHPDTAKSLEIEDGDWVYIENKRGRIKQKAKLTTGIDPRVINVDYGWWFPEKGVEGLYGWAESNANILTGSEPPYSPEMGSNNLRGIICKVYKE